MSGWTPRRNTHLRWPPVFRKLVVAVLTCGLHNRSGEPRYANSSLHELPLEMQYAIFEALSTSFVPCRDYFVRRPMRRLTTRRGEPFSMPAGVAVDPEGGVLIQENSIHRLNFLDHDYTVVETLKRTGAALAVARDGTIILADTLFDRLQVRHPVTRGRDPWQDVADLRAPVAVATGPDGSVFVYEAGTGADVLTRFVRGLSGRRETIPAGSGLLEGNSTVLVGIAVTSDGDIVIADRKHQRIMILHPDGSFKSEIRGEGSFALLRPHCVALDGAENIVVTDSRARRILVFRQNGEMVWQCDGTEWPEGIELDGPAGVAVAKDGGIIITEPYLDSVLLM